MPSSDPHTLAVVLFDGVVIGDFGPLCDLFSRFQSADGRHPYRVRVCGAKRWIRTDHCALKAPFSLAGLQLAQTIIVPGIANPQFPVPKAVITAIRSAAARGARIASVCSGAFVLAMTGLLDGRRVTTHWLAAAELARRYPSLEVDPAVLYVDHGKILTSAGAAAALDMALHIIRTDHGAAVAAEAARIAVMPLERAGGQAQFIKHSPPTGDGSSLKPLLTWMQENLHRTLTVPRLASRAGLSVRTLHRRFHEQTGTTPIDWLLTARIRHGQHLLETTNQSVEHVAGACGFGAGSSFRERFRAITGTSPSTYRQTFGRSRIQAV
jgi:transcriptional regulator GlxA family with amidase domain